tara:strand:+ start:330 stop:524 length:195 start_codon:yes stop_codon:yes gene_type:complete
MKNKILLSLLYIGSLLIASCKNGCMECTGTSAPREFCEDDYIEKGDYEAEISAYEATGGVCEKS